MTYREAKALQTLHAQINKMAPRRSVRSDGWIGDAAHASRDSDHNPWVKDRNGVGVVRARDFTHDPNNGLDCNRLADRLVALLGGKHPAMGADAYVIWNRRIISSNRLGEGWRAYSGSNPHTQHLHLSVGTSGYDSAAPWVLTVPQRPTRITQARELLVKAYRATRHPLRRRKLRDALETLPKR